MCTNLGSFMGLPREVACGSRRMKDAKTREGRALRQVKLPPPVSFYIIQIMRHSHAAKVGRRSGEGQGLLAQVPQWRRLARHRLTHVNTRQDPVRPKCRYCKKAGDNELMRIVTDASTLRVTVALVTFVCCFLMGMTRTAAAQSIDRRKRKTTR